MYDFFCSASGVCEDECCFVLLDECVDEFVEFGLCFFEGCCDEVFYRTENF